VVAAPVIGPATARATFAGLLVAMAAVLAACSLGGAGGEAVLAVAVDETHPDRPVLVPAPEVVEIDRQYLIRLEVPATLHADEVRVRVEKRVGASHQQRREFFHPVTPPWRVAVIPISATDAGEWNIALIVNSRKITDVRFRAERP
jgi:hypothetical protein